MNIVVACDENFVEHAGVLVASLEQTHLTQDLHVFLMHPGLDERVLEWIAIQGRDRVRVSPHLVTQALDEIRMPAYLPVTAAFRLLFPLIAPEGWRHAIYLDADMLVRGSLEPVWNLRSTVELVALVRDAVVPAFGSWQGPPWRALGADPTAPYFNSGMMLFNLDEWRRSDCSNKALHLMQNFSLPYGDQCAINAVCTGRVFELDPIWNAMAAIFRDDSSIAATEGAARLLQLRTDSVVIHFNTDRLGRPWVAGCLHPLKALWTKQHSNLLGRPPVNRSTDIGNGSEHRVTTVIRRIGRLAQGVACRLERLAEAWETRQSRG